jgi:hypothetical protein
MLNRFLSATAFLALLLALPVWAHHAFEAEFDGDKPVKLEGKVVKMEWINPHTWIHLDVTAEDGTVQRWMVEGGSPNIMVRRGFTKTSLEEGTEIVVEGFHARNGRNRASGRSVTFPDGTRLFTGGSADGQNKGKQ